MQPGTRLGPYEIVSRIGAGGMGEVWRAVDTRLGREVAIKILPAEFAKDAKLKVRLEREARTISHLSHPNICTLFDIGENYIVMELLDGESLADRLARGPLPLSEVVRIGAQIAEALAKAHREGVVHRDVKPGNIMLTKSGAKLLDFGLAKSVEARPTPEAATVQKPLTEEGTIVGTFHYMAPEQLTGEEPDARSDIFALGTVLYEMATGQRAFEGKNRTSLIGAILRADPRPVRELQPLTPPALEHVIVKCLAKDRDERWQNASDVAEELRWIGQSGSGSSQSIATPAPRLMRKNAIAWLTIVTLLSAAVAALSYLYMGARRNATERVELSIVPEEGMKFYSRIPALAISPDGRSVVIGANRPGSGVALWLRRIDEPSSRLIEGTQGEVNAPFWSSDGRSMAFSKDGKLKRLDFSSGSVQTLCDNVLGGRGTWSSDGQILLAMPDGLFRIPASGGEPIRVTSLDQSRHETLQTSPAMLSDGRHFVVIDHTRGDQRNEIRAGTLEKTGPLKFITKADALVGFSSPYLLYVVDNTLYAHHLDEKSLQLIGERQEIASGVLFLEIAASSGATVSERTIAYVPARLPKTDIAIVTRIGGQVETLRSGHAINQLAASPDGTKLLLEEIDPGKGIGEIWSYDLVRHTETRLTSGLAAYVLPVWSPDGERFAFASDAAGALDIYVEDANEASAPRVLWKSDQDKFAWSWSRDGTLYAGVVSPKSGDDIWSFPIAGGTPAEVFRSDAEDSEARISPDGTLLAFRSYRSGGSQVYLRSRSGGGIVQVTNVGGIEPHWSRDGKELFYLSGAASSDRRTFMMMAVPVRMTGNRIDVGEAHPLFAMPPTSISGERAWDVLPDGRFAIVVAGEEGMPRYVNVIVNWRSGLRK